MIIKNKLFYFIIGETKIMNSTIRKYNSHKLITTLEEENSITELALELLKPSSYLSNDNFDKESYQNL